MKPNTTFFDRLPKLTSWEQFRITLAVRWAFAKLYLCQASPFLSLNDAGEEFMYARRPWLARRFFRHVTVLHPSQPVPQPV